MLLPTSLGIWQDETARAGMTAMAFGMNFKCRQRGGSVQRRRQHGCGRRGASQRCRTPKLECGSQRCERRRGRPRRRQALPSLRQGRRAGAQADALRGLQEGEGTRVAEEGGGVRWLWPFCKRLSCEGSPYGIYSTQHACLPSSCAGTVLLGGVPGPGLAQRAPRGVRPPAAGQRLSSRASACMLGLVPHGVCTNAHRLVKEKTTL